jgi:hypothetical protein
MLWSSYWKKSIFKGERNGENMLEKVNAHIYFPVKTSKVPTNFLLFRLRLCAPSWNTILD